MRTSTIALIVCETLLVAAFPAQAGWFTIFNFKGSIGSYPITLSLQMYKEPSKCKIFPGPNCFSVDGLYRYNKVNELIPLEGEMQGKTGNVVLKEMKPGRPLGRMTPKDTIQARFEFAFSQKSSQGIWKSLISPKSHPLHLEFVSSLVDTFNINLDSTEKSAGPVEIHMQESAAGQFFVGVYDYDYQKYGEQNAVMTSLKVLDKKTGRLIQSITLPRDEYRSMGACNTIIFQNVGYEDGVLWVAWASNGSVEYRWNRKKSRYEQLPDN